MITNLGRPAANDPPEVEEENPKRDKEQHGLGRDLVAPLNKPKETNAGSLTGDADHEQPIERDRVKRDDFVLKRGDDLPAGEVSQRHKERGRDSRSPSC